MKIVNTSEYPTNVLRKLVGYIADIIEVRQYVENVEITKCTFGYRGRCWGKRVLVRIGKTGHFPVKDVSYPGLDTAPKYDLNDWLEAFVHLTAHELQHSRQFMTKARKSEIDAERIALYVLNRFRKDRPTLQPELDRLACIEIAGKAARKAIVEVKRTPEAKIVQLHHKIARWTTKKKLAETYIKKYQRALRYQEKKLEAARQL